MSVRQKRKCWLTTFNKRHLLGHRCAGLLCHEQPVKTAGNNGTVELFVLPENRQQILRSF